jgi:hypothetical protein
MRKCIMCAELFTCHSRASASNGNAQWRILSKIRTPVHETDSLQNWDQGRWLKSQRLRLLFGKFRVRISAEILTTTTGKFCSFSSDTPITTRYNTSNQATTHRITYWGFGLIPSSGVLGSRNTTFRKLDISFLRWKGEKTPAQLGLSERTNLNHWGPNE